MKEQGPITRFLTRADNLAIALATKRALTNLDNSGHDNPSDPVAKVLTNSQENLRIARLISERVNPIKKELLRSFGEGLHLQLGKKLGERALNDQWSLRRHHSKAWTSAYAGSSFWPIREAEKADAPCLFIIIQRTSNYVNLGISRSEVRSKRPEYWALPPVKDLAIWLKQHGYGPHLWWLGYRNLYGLREDELYLALAGNMNEIVTETTDATYKLFDETREFLEEANQALVQHFSSS